MTSYFYNRSIRDKMFKGAPPLFVVSRSAKPSYALSVVFSLCQAFFCGQIVTFCAADFVAFQLLAAASTPPSPGDVCFRLLTKKNQVRTMPNLLALGVRCQCTTWSVGACNLGEAWIHRASYLSGTTDPVNGPHVKVRTYRKLQIFPRFFAD